MLGKIYKAQARVERFLACLGDNLEGCNVLGRLLMELRTQLVSDPKQLRAVARVLIAAFQLLEQPIGTVMVG